MAEDYRISEKQFVLFESLNPNNMITTIRRLCNLVVLLLLFIYSNAQDLRSYNQNNARSNHAKALSVFISPVYSSSTSGNKDSLLFRGNGSGLRVGGDYFFGKAGIGFNTGFSSSSVNDAAINNFLKNNGVPQDQMLITKAKQQNMYLLLGPSLRFGNKVELYAHAKAGVFMNNGGLVNIQQRGAIRAAYRNESTDKNIYPGFLTGLNVQYKTKSDMWSFGVGVDYMNTKSEVNNYDARRGNGIEGLKLSSNIQDIVAGISVRYNIFSGREHSSGQSTGRVLPTVNKRETKPRDAASGLATGKTYQPGRPVYGNLTSEETNNAANCGPVTKKTTFGDGSTEEMTFSCPADALAYERQTPKRDFGERAVKTRSNIQNNRTGNTENNNDPKSTYVVPHILEGKGMISGSLTWASPKSGGIVTNAVITSSPRGGSTTMNSQTSSTRTTNQSSFGTMVRLSARDAASGLATGKRSRDAASGLATGRRQYEPIFVDGQGEVCNPCLATAKMSNIKNNPLYVDKGVQGENPLYESNKRTTGGDDDCDGVAGADIYLINAESNEVVAKTKTEQCGDFFFANVPNGNYVVRVSAAYLSKKGYDVYLKSKTDIAGAVSQADDWMQLVINNSTGDNGNTQKAGISTSRSNLRTKSISIIEADLDGDGEYESLKVLAELDNGATKDITANARMSNTAQVKKVTVRGWDPEKKQAIVGSTTGTKEFTISIDDDNNVLFTTQRENGTKDEIKATAKVSHHPNVVQFIIPLNDDVPTTGAKITKSRSNIQNNRTKSGDTDDDGIWSPRSNIKMIRVAAGDVDGDGTMDITGGNLRTEFAVLRDRLKDRFENGDIPTEQQRTVGGMLPGGAVISGGAMRPGSPIGGLSIKGGKNPGGNLRTIQTNENGEFEFPNLDAGDYTFTMEQNLMVDDETFVTVGGDVEENTVVGQYNPKELAVKKDQPATVDSKNGGYSTRAQDHNSSRSNKTASIIANDVDPDDTEDSNSVLSESDAKKPITFRWSQATPQGGGPVTYRLRVWQLMEGQNGTQAMRSNKPVTEKSVTNTTETSVQGILTGPCKPPYLCDFVWGVQAFNAAGNPIGNTESTNGGRFSVAQSSNDQSNTTKAQNNNTVRSNRTELKSILIEADLDGDGEYETNVSNKLSDELVMDNEGNTTPQQKAGVSTSRSNIRTRNGLVDKGDGIFVSYGTASIDNKDVGVKLVYKSTHEMQMSAIRNLK